MGVGAIFVSTLALHRLPEPRNPPQTQEDLLALALHPVVTFVVLVSIVVRECGSSTLSRNIHVTIDVVTQMVFLYYSGTWGVSSSRKGFHHPALSTMAQEFPFHLLTCRWLLLHTLPMILRCLFTRSPAFMHLSCLLLPWWEKSQLYIELFPKEFWKNVSQVGRSLHVSPNE